MALHSAQVDIGLRGMRVDIAARRLFPELPAPTLREAFERRDVKLNGKRVKPDARVAVGDELNIYAMETAMNLVVVYEDDDVLLVNKRAGISVTADEGGGVTLTELCGRYVRAKDENAFLPRPVHRLDNATCGLTLFAKNEAAEEALVEAFRLRLPKKTYTCLVRGIPKPPAAVCRAWLVKDAERARVAIFDREVRDAKPIATAYETLEAGPVSRLRVDLLTGRTHQIRAHMASLGHPLLGDDVYGDRDFNREKKARRLMLCATSLTLQTGGKLPQLDGKTFTVPCPF